jgi:DNA/RNA endonuclease YhcR with UshA esterase domain
MICKLWSKILLGAVVFSLMALTVTAQKAQKIKDGGPKYDLANEVKIKGVVEDIRESQGEPGGVLLLIKADTGEVPVYVGPQAFLKEIEVSFSKGDQVEVVGAKALNTAEGVVLAREITVGNNSFTLRDDKGTPAWTGWKPAKTSGR